MAVQQSAGRRQRKAAEANQPNLREATLHKRSITSSEAAVLAATVAIEERGLDVSVLEIKQLSDIADCFVIVSGTSDRHVKNIADKIAAAMKGKGDAPIAISGLEAGEWVLLDYGDVVIHVFYEPTRQFYNLDGLWSRAKTLRLPEDIEEQARKLRTGILPPSRFS